MMKPKSAGQTYLAIFLLSMNMRLPITALPPILPQIIRASGLPTSLAGIITTIPLLLFALGSPLIAKCAARFGRELTVVFFFALLSLGSLLRIKLAIPTLMLGTILIGLGIDGGNILLPSIIKDKLPHRELLGISLYTGGMNLISAIDIGSIVALTALWGLTQTMGALFAFSLLSLGGALLLHPRMVTHRSQAARGAVHFWHSPHAWGITAFFGLQALLYYSLITWLPTMLGNAGFAAKQASLLVTLVQLVCLLFTTITPALVKTVWSRRLIATACFIGFAGGTSGIMVTTLGNWWTGGMAILIGMAGGMSFNLAIDFFSLKTRQPQETVAISSMAQAIGYFFAAAGPLTFGFLHAHLHSWTVVIGLIIILAAGLLVAGWLVDTQDHLAAD